MTDTSETRGVSPGPAIPPDLRLRPERPRVVRLSRRVLVGLGAVAGVVVAGTLIYALQPGDGDQAPEELHSTEGQQPAEGIRSLPADYTAIPQLGPPLPGDLGSAAQRALERGEPVEVQIVTQPVGADPEEQRRIAEIEAARVSRLFFQTETQTSAGISVENSSIVQSGSGLTFPLGLPEAQSEPTDQERKLAFLEADVDRRTVSLDGLADPASPFVVQAGSVIPAALLTGIRSDLPGLVTAQVTSHVYDSPTGLHLLIPQGSRLIGQYDSEIAFGQSRILLVWNRLILPNGKSIVLERQVGTDPQGYAGLEDEVDYHWGQLFQAAALSTLLGVATGMGGNDDESDIARAIRESTQGNVQDIGDQIVGRQLDVQSTLMIRQGFPLRVLVNRDLVLEPYGDDVQ